MLVEFGRRIDVDRATGHTPGPALMPDVPASASEHPPTWKFGYPIHHVEHRSELRAWLEANAAAVPGLWICTWKRSSGNPVCPYPEIVEEAICFGWIDSTVNTLDEDRALQLLTRRKPKSTWTRLNRRRVDELERAGLMTDAGRRSVEVAKANGWWTIYDPVEDLLEPGELATALDAVPPARAAWDGFPPSARKQMLWWVISAAKPETRTERIATIVRDAAAGARSRG